MPNSASDQVESKRPKFSKAQSSEQRCAVIMRSALSLGPRKCPESEKMNVLRFAHFALISALLCPASLIADPLRPTLRVAADGMSRDTARAGISAGDGVATLAGQSEPRFTLKPALDTTAFVGHRGTVVHGPVRDDHLGAFVGENLRGRTQRCRARRGARRPRRTSWYPLRSSRRCRAP